MKGAENIAHEKYMGGYRKGKQEIINKIRSYLDSEENEIGKKEVKI